MSLKDVEFVRQGYEVFAAGGEFSAEFVTSDFVWDMTNFHGWMEQQVYEGVEGTRRFLADWTSAWEDYVLEVDELHDAGEKVVALMHQSGRSKAAGMPVEMSFAQVWTMREGKQARMDMYSDPAEALRANGLFA